MSTEIILAYAIGVFVLMGIGMYLTMLEFNRLQKESAASDAAASHREGDHAKSAPEQPSLRAVDDARGR